MKAFFGSVKKLFSCEKGLVTIEWVGIAAAVVLASIVISSSMLQGASNLGGAVTDKLNDAADVVSGEEEGTGTR